jgi:hypothetical protein
MRQGERSRRRSALERLHPPSRGYPRAEPRGQAGVLAGPSRPRAGEREAVGLEARPQRVLELCLRRVGDPAREAARRSRTADRPRLHLPRRSNPCNARRRQIPAAEKHADPRGPRVFSACSAPVVPPTATKGAARRALVGRNRCRCDLEQGRFTPGDVDRFVSRMWIDALSRNLPRESMPGASVVEPWRRAMIGVSFAGRHPGRDPARRGDRGRRGLEARVGRECAFAPGAGTRLAPSRHESGPNDSCILGCEGIPNRRQRSDREWSV